MKKRSIYFLLSSAVALAGIFGLSGCSSSDDVTVNNPKYNPETNEVYAQFVFNVATGNTPSTRQTSEATQATSTDKFRGIDNAVLFAYKQSADGKHLATATTADKRYELSRIISAGKIDQEESHRVIETSLPLNTNTLLFYGKAIEGSASETQIAEGITAYDLFGHLEKYSVGESEEGLDIDKTNFELSSRISGNKENFDKIGSLLAGVLTCIMNTNLAGNNHQAIHAADGYTFDVDVTEYPELKWADYVSSGAMSPMTLTKKQYALEIKMADAYREMTTIQDDQGELRAGYGAAIVSTIQNLWSVVNEVRCAIPFSKEEAVAKLLAEKVHERIKQYFNGEVPSNGQNVMDVSYETTQNIINHFVADQWPATADAKPTDFESIKNARLVDFPWKMYHVSVGSAHYLFDAAKQQFNYVQNYNTSAVGNAGGFTVESYYYPPELLYFGNSPIRVSTKEHKPDTYPNGVINWDNDQKWATDWEKDSHVTAATQSVAMKNNINYGTSLLKTTISYGASVLKDNNHAIQKAKDPSLTDAQEPDKEIPVGSTSFQLAGVIVGGQWKKVGWDFLPKTTNNEQGYVYDYAINDASIPATGTSAPNYTLVFDNYNATSAANSQPQDKVYIALELINNTEQWFFGEHGIVPPDGIFYLIGELDPNKAGLTAPIWPSNHPLPPYKADGSSIQTQRVFMQDFMTVANFVIGENSLKHAYLTVPDLRYSALTLGLNVDMEWKTGLDFGDVIVGGE